MSFARVAEEMHLMPALSIQVRQLAEAAGQPFFRTDPAGHLSGTLIVSTFNQEGTRNKVLCTT